MRTKVDSNASSLATILMSYAAGPLELTRRTKVLVWDDEIPVTDDMFPEPTMSNGSSSHSTHVPTISPHASIASMPLPTQTRHARSQSVSGFPPPIRRMSTDMVGISRPVSFSAKFQRVHPATTGVTVLEHMERLDAVEAGLKRLAVDENVVQDDEEVDVGESSSSVRSQNRIPSSAPPGQTTFTSPPLSREPSGEGGVGLLSPGGTSERLPAVPEADDAESHNALEMSFAEEDLVALSKSTSQIEVPALHTRFASFQNHTREGERPSLEWMQSDPASESPKVRTAIVEVST